MQIVLGKLMDSSKGYYYNSVNSDLFNTEQDRPSTPIKIQKAKKQLQNLPSPTQMHQQSLSLAEDEEMPEMNIESNEPMGKVSIGELNPFFEEIAFSSDESSVEEYIIGNNGNQLDDEEAPPLPQNSAKCKRTSSIRKILSSVGAAPKATNTLSQDSISSSSVMSASTTQLHSLHNPTLEKGKRNFKTKFKSVSEKVRRQFSSTGDFIVDKFTSQNGRGDGYYNTEDAVPKNWAQHQELVSTKNENESVSKTTPKTPVSTVFENLNERNSYDYERSGCNKDSLTFSSEKSKQKVEERGSEIVWSLPNWFENPVQQKNQNTIVSPLQEVMESEKEKMAQRQQMDWAESINYLKKSVGRDFRRGYLVLGEKMQLPNMQVVRCLKFHPNNFLAVGCENGNLTVLQMNYDMPFTQEQAHGVRSDESISNRLYNMPSGNQCRIQMNQSLIGHTYDLKCLTWNNVSGMLISSDEIGVIIGWALSDKGYWVETLINDTSSSLIRCMSWSPDGTKIAIGYEDYSESGNVTGGLLVGYGDGTHIFDRKFPDSQVSCIEWYSNAVVWVVANSTLYSFDEKGGVGSICRQLVKGTDGVEMACFLFKPRTSWVMTENAPEFAVVYKNSCMTLFASIEDKSPVKIFTKLVATCADWCANGLYIAVGGMPIVTGDYVASPKINLYNYEGNLLQIVKIPGKSVTNICWDHDSLHLAVSTRRHIYFANLRPMYKVTSNASTHCYAYTHDSVKQILTFWNGNTRFTEVIPGKVIDLKCFKDKFSVLYMDASGIYHVFVFGETGVHEQHLCITTMEPFSITMTKYSVICLASNAILHWNYSLDTSKKFTGALKKTRQVHVDDFPSIVPKPGERENHLQRATVNSARCMDATKDQLCIARESGRLQLYALPTLGFLQAYQLDLFEGDICQQLSFNNDGSRIAMLTMNGQLKIFLFPEATLAGTEVVDCDEFNSIESILWATDIKNVLCVLEGNDVHIVRECVPVESIGRIPSGSHLTKFENLEITVLDVESIIENPENPLPSHVLKAKVPTLRKIKADIYNQEPFEDILRILNNTVYDHSILRELVAEEALKQEEYTIAEHIYGYDRNYLAIQFLERIRDIDLHELKRAETFLFLKDYEQAQHYFVRAERKDLAVNMWRDLGNWEKVDSLTRCLSDNIIKEALECGYEECVQNEDWEQAHELCLKLENAEGILKCCLMQDDYSKLINLSDRLPSKDPLLKKIGDILACNGLVEEAAKCYLDNGDPVSAMRAAVDTRHWDLAIRLSHQYDLPLITPSLVLHVQSLISANNLNPAIQILVRCGKSITAGKLLVWKGLYMLQDDKNNTLDIKKVFVLAAITLSKCKNKPTNRTKKASKPCLGKTKLNDSQELDLEFLIPEKELKIMNGHNEWCWSDPWRGAEAMHFLNLTQKFIYRKMSGRAFKAAIYLRSFEDIIGSERVNSLVALTAVNDECFRVASNALLKLEGLDESYSAISFNLFKENSPEDRNVTRIPCPVCQKSIPDYHSACPCCNTKMFMCIFSASPIIREDEMWTCQVCSRHVEITKRDRFDYCPLCHSKADAM